MRRRIVINLQSDRGAEVTLRELALKGLTKVRDLFFVNKQITIARDAPLITALHMHTRKQISDKSTQKSSQQNETVWGTRYGGRNLDQTWQGSRSLHNGNRRLTPKRIGAG